MSYAPMPGLPPLTIPAMRCGLGAEPTPEAFIGHLILVMREMWRVLRDDGVCFVNLGDSYNGSGGAGGDYNPGGSKEGQPKYPGRKISTLKPKDLMLIPARFALAAQAEGWYIRSAMPWIKRNCMPESVTDRPATTIESIYMLAKSEKYYFDMEAIKQPIASVQKGKAASFKRTGSKRGDSIVPGQGYGTHREDREEHEIASDGLRSFRSSDFFLKSWQGMLAADGEPLAMVVNPKGYSEAHFATFPLELPLTCIKAGSSEHGVCGACGAPWERVTEKPDMANRPRRSEEAKYKQDKYMGATSAGQAYQEWRNANPNITTGWQPTCTCNAGEAIPATVLDPFSGSATSGRAAMQLNRSYIGLDICQSYLEDLAPARMSNVQIEMALA